MNINTTIRLNNGVEMPILGLGTWKSSPKEVGQAIKWSFEAGYRHIDTAEAYDNEEAVGDAIKESNMRKYIFLTTKLWNQNYDNPEKALNNRLRKLQTYYVALYLLQWPVPKVKFKTWERLESM